jgi:putative transposase
MFGLLRAFIAALLRVFRTRRSLLLENLALRQQLAVLKGRRPKIKLVLADKMFWVLARRFWSGWKSAVAIVEPETVAHWHRTGFQMYWRWISHFKRRTGRKQISKELRELIFRMTAENPTWGAPRTHGELPMLGFDVSERTMSRWMRKAPRDPERGKRWLVFLRNHREVIAAIDFFTIRRSHSACCTASSSSAMPAGGLYISM